MSASRISPVRGSTWLGPMAPNSGCALIIQRTDAHADVERVEVGIVGLHLDDDGVLEADALERLVPFEDAVASSHRGTSRGIVRSSQKVIGFTGSDIAAVGSFFSRRQRLI